jgi:hypothetical protein
MFLACRPATDCTEGEGEQYVAHPDFPHLPPDAPLTFALTMKACLSQKHTERPTFNQILQLLRDLQKEVGHGTYVDSTGRVQVPRFPAALVFVYLSLFLCLCLFVFVYFTLAMVCCQESLVVHSNDLWRLLTNCNTRTTLARS